MSVLRRFITRSACALALLCAGAVPALAQVTIVQNGFEDGTTQAWGPRGSVSVTASTEAANSGAYSLKTMGRTAEWNGPSLNVFPLLATGRTYQMTGWVRLVAGTAAGQVVFTVQRTTGGTTSYDRVAAANATDGAWVRLQGIYSFPTGTTALSLYLESGDATAAYYLDDFSITELSGSGCPVPLDQTGFASTFEDGTAQGWGRRGSETVDVTSADAHSGAYALLASNRTQPWHGPSHDAQCKMHNGSRYRVSLWAKLAPGEPDALLRVSIQRSYAGQTNYNTVLASKTVTANEWVLFDGNYTFAYDTTALSIYVESSAAVGDPPRHPSFYIDDFVLAHHPPPPIQTLPPVKDALDGFFLAGTAIEPSQTTGLHAELLLRHFNSVTAENAMKFGSIHPAESTYNFGPADTIANFARSHGLTMRGHTLLWHEQAPAWLFQHSDGTPLMPGVDRELLLARLKAHIDTVVGRYNDVVSSWDVVNEPIDANQPGGLRVTPWLEIIGPDYIDRAFEYARAAAGPDVKLYINEYSTTNPAKRQAYLHVVEGMLARGVPFDGVGHQMHINVYQPSVAEIRTTLQVFGDLGLDNQITEMDMSVYADSSGSYAEIPDEVLLLQGHRYKEIFAELRRQRDILSSVTLWGLGDDTSWLRRSRLDAPLLFDEDLQAKWAYWGVVDPSELPVLIQTLEVSGGTAHVDAGSDAIWDLVTPVAIPSEGPLSASFKALWDDGHLYLRVDVADATPGGGDAIDVFIDEDNGKTPAYGADDAHYAFDRFGNTLGSGVRALLLPARNGYRLEAAIPLLQIAAEGRQIGFDLRIRDGAGQAISWNDTTNGQDADTSRFGVVALVRPIEASGAARGTPLIDGIEDPAWEKTAEFSTDTWVLGGTGATARVKTLWDEGHLYVFAKVSDPLLSTASTNPWEQDSVEIFVDQNNAKTNYYEADDGQYRVNCANAQSFGGAASAATFFTATRVVEGGYVVEAAITLGSPAYAGQLIGFDFQVNDDGTGTGVRSSVVTWSDTSGLAYLDPSRFGVLRLHMGSTAQPAAK